MRSTDLQKRVSALKKQLEGQAAGIGFFRAFLIAFVSLCVVTPFLSFSSEDREESYRRDQHIILEMLEAYPSSVKPAVRSLRANLSQRSNSLSGIDVVGSEKRLQIEQQIFQRVAWLYSTPFRSGAAINYLEFADTTIAEFLPGNITIVNDDLALLDWDEWSGAAYVAFTLTMLRIGFVIIAFWPVWIILGVAGYFLAPVVFKNRRTNDLLGICQRGNTPFYSGIYGPLKLNSGISATDLSVPSLACPDMVAEPFALKHSLISTLKSHRALNRTNLDLVRIILAYKDLPAYVEDERAAEEIPIDEGAEGGANTPPPPRVIISNADGKLEDSAMTGLIAILEAHQTLCNYHREPQGAANSLEERFPEIRGEIEERAKKLTPQARLMLLSLTNARGLALTKLSPAIIATGYLAIEAGKCLVFNKSGNGFTQISQFPHLQARAVVQSLTGFHRDYKGDARLVIRQAIICARRHGDFGRAFLPSSMPTTSRALRDLLEIGYTHPKRMQDTANLVELEAHLEEIYFNWKARLSERLRAEQRRKSSLARSVSEPYALWKGLSYKSVILMPLQNVVETALSGVHDARCRRVTELGDLTKRLFSSLSISARLPGFKRQAVEARQNSVVSEEMAAVFNANDQGRNLVERWFIIRRMLTRYNWLSTRVGDFNVPADGLVQTVYIDRSQETFASSGEHTGQPEVIGLDTLVPLRQRRYREVLGANWEQSFFNDSPHQEDVNVFVDQKDFHDALKHTMEQARKGLLRSGTNGAKSAVA